MHWHFGPFRLDLANACLWHAEQLVILRPKTFAVLVYLVTHAGQLVTKEALFDAIWPETAVGDGVLKTSMNELRKALGETAKAPQWIATVYRRGYRFVAPVTLMESLPTGGPAGARPSFRHAPSACVHPDADAASGGARGRSRHPAPVVCQRHQGERHLGFVRAGWHWQDHSGGHFRRPARRPGALWIGRGQCIEQYGAGEAYLPLLEALGQMGRTQTAPD